MKTCIILGMGLISISKAAKIYGVHPDTLRNWEKDGKISSIRTKGNHRRFNETEIRTCQILDFWRSILDQDKNVQWFEFFVKSDPTMAAASAYASRHFTSELDHLRFVINAVAYEKMQDTSVNWRRNGIQKDQLSKKN